MVGVRRWAGVAIPALLIGICGAAIAADAEETLYVRSEMLGAVNEATAALWDVGNNAMGENGDIDPRLMSEEAWDRIAAAAAILEASSRRMADAHTIKAALPGHELDEQPDAYSMADVQRYIDEDPQMFRAMAQAMADHSAKVQAAAHSRQAGETSLLIGELDQICETCHVRYWYPEG